MLIRPATETDRPIIVDIYRKSQAATGIPNPEYFPPDQLEEYLYGRDAIERLVAEVSGKVVCHTLIENPNPKHIEKWQAGLEDKSKPKLLELGGSFVDPDFSKQGIWGGLFYYSILLARLNQAVPVSVTWAQNDHVKRKFISFGGREVGTHTTLAGDLNLFVFP
jgi:hypothetical protein